jgi:pimeloyl-ACP methyl ester carboxylesterase
MTPLVLLPGMMCDGRLFGPQIAAFGDRALHLASMVGAVTVQELAAQILAGAPPRFALAGLSMGGIVAMEIIAQAPGRVTHFALLDTNPRAEMPEVQARRATQIAKVQAGGLEAVMRDEMKPNYLTDGPNRGAILGLCMDMALSLGPRAFVNQSLALRDRPDQQATLSRVTVPTLVLCGRQDTLCPVERHELMHALIPHSTLHIVENAGHLPTLEQPDLTTAALRHWLEA